MELFLKFSVLFFHLNARKSYRLSKTLSDYLRPCILFEGAIYSITISCSATGAGSMGIRQSGLYKRGGSRAKRAKETRVDTYNEWFFNTKKGEAWPLLLRFIDCAGFKGDGFIYGFDYFKIVHILYIQVDGDLFDFA